MTTCKADLSNPIYHDDEAARTHLESLLWPNGAVCPRCAGGRVTKLKGTSTRPGVYKCKDCRKPFTVTVGTVMERSKVPLSKWVLAAHFMAASKKGMSALQLQRMLGTNYETAWFLFHRLRECCVRDDATLLGGEGKIIEADETFVGGLEKNKHLNKRLGRSLARDTKKAIVTLVERGGEARSFHVANVTAKTIRSIVTSHADKKSHLMTDGGTPYITLGEEFSGHGRTDHARGEYVREGFTHSNTAESYFAILKRGVYGSFHSISEAHMQRYLYEFDFKYSTRKIDDVSRCEILLKGAAGKRLVYHGA